ncbi:hypothetical protein [Streptomyces sp. NBC_01190]|uniref:hypothetical protein n=1 Tax=Streptomyces sp. NBC_01190 TaxID=2903767 RepID=UPI00386A8CCE|nr:hypothetical protein OG519_16285 [Streptomyces sp. NBC_01190]
MFHQLLRAAAWFALRVFPATNHHRHRPPTHGTPHRAADRTSSTPSRFAARERRIRADDIPLVRPYVLNPEEWARWREMAVPVG